MPKVRCLNYKTLSLKVMLAFAISHTYPRHDRKKFVRYFLNPKMLPESYASFYQWCTGATTSSIITLNLLYISSLPVPGVAVWFKPSTFGWWSLCSTTVLLLLAIWPISTTTLIEHGIGQNGAIFQHSVSLYRMSFCQILFCQMSFSQMSFCQMSFCQILFCQMSFSQMSSCQMSFYQMSFCQMSFYRMSFCQMSWRHGTNICGQLWLKVM